MSQYKKATLVMDYLQDLGLSMVTIGPAIDDSKLEKSYQLIMDNPQITKEEFLTEMGLEDFED